MGDISEMRGLIVLFVIVAVTISLIVLIPGEFYTAGVEEGEQIDPDTLDLVAWNSTYILNMTASDQFTFELNGYNMYILTLDGDRFFASTYAQWWLFYWDYDYFRFYFGGVDYSDETYDNIPFMNLTTLDSEFSGTDYNETIKLLWRNGKTQLTGTLSYNGSAYTGYEDALTNDALTCVFNVDWNDRNTSMNALQLVAMVLTGSLPNIAPELSVVFGFMGWAVVACAVYLTFIFILRIVGAVFGGGGA